MTLDYPKHKNILLQILKDIFSDTSLSPYLGFKGGTAALMFYDLTRNSVDIDLDLLDETKEQEVFEKIQKNSYGLRQDCRLKNKTIQSRYGYFI
jgi:predicted nucleotidyltransferase component of viral defense system